MSHPDRADAGVTAFLLSQIGSVATRRFGEYVGRLRLTPAQTSVIRAIGLDPGRSQQALAHQLDLMPSRLVAMIDDLEEAGLVERRRNVTDRRLYALHLAPAGRRRLGEIGDAVREHGEDLLDGLEGPERDELAHLLTRLAETLMLPLGVHPGYRTLEEAQARRERIEHDD